VLHGLEAISFGFHVSRYYHSCIETALGEEKSRQPEFSSLECSSQPIFPRQKRSEPFFFSLTSPNNGLYIPGQAKEGMIP
jgi:hypothetical protein